MKNKPTRKRLTEMQSGDVFKIRYKGEIIIGVYDGRKSVQGGFLYGTVVKYHTCDLKARELVFFNLAPEAVYLHVIGNIERKKVDIPTLILSVVAALIVSLIVCSAFCYVPKIERVEWEEVTHKVERGETLWEISKLYCPGDVDCRDWIEKVKEINGIGSTIYTGDRLTVLVEKNN